MRIGRSHKTIRCCQQLSSSFSFFEKLFLSGNFFSGMNRLTENTRYVTADSQLRGWETATTWMQLPALVKPNVASTELQFAARDLEADESLGSFLSEELEQKFCCETLYCGCIYIHDTAAAVAASAPCKHSAPHVCSDTAPAHPQPSSVLGEHSQPLARGTTATVGSV
jgi:hypothetical protein